MTTTHHCGKDDSISHVTYDGHQWLFFDYAITHCPYCGANLPTLLHVEAQKERTAVVQMLREIEKNQYFNVGIGQSLADRIERGEHRR